MSGLRFRPRRRLRSELLPLLLILMLPFSLILAFPSGAVGFVPHVESVVRVCDNAMIVLDSKRESALLAAARSAWRYDAASHRGVRADLLSCDFSRANVRVAAGLEPVFPERDPGGLEYGIDPIPSGVAAPEPAVFESVTESAPGPTFPKSELLRLKEESR